MGCAEFEVLLSAHLDDELNAAEEATVSEHLRLCAACRQALGDLKRTQALVRDLKRVPVPATLWPAIERKIRTKMPVLPFAVRLTRGFAALAASFALLVGLIAVVGYYALEPVSTRDSNIYLGGHAYHLMRQPLADRSSWSYVAGESNFDLISAEE